MKYSKQKKKKTEHFTLNKNSTVNMNKLFLKLLIGICLTPK